MSNQWFRMYSEFAFDPKVQVLTEALQRRYVMALCLHCDNKLQNRPNDEIALSLRVTVEDWEETKSVFIKRGLFTQDGIPHGWDKRQYISDIKDPGAAARQKRYRDKIRNTRNATVTSRLPEADTDTESKKVKDADASKKNGSRFAIIELPNEWKEFCLKNRPDLDPEELFQEFRDYWTGIPGQRGRKLDWLGTWRNRVRDKKKFTGIIKLSQSAIVAQNDRNARKGASVI